MGRLTAKEIELSQQLTATQRLVLVAHFKTTLTLEEAAAYAGVSVSHFHKLTSAKKIPHYQPSGKHIYFDRVELDNWLKRNRIKSTEEVERELSISVSAKSAAKEEVEVK